MMGTCIEAVHILSDSVNKDLKPEMGTRALVLGPARYHTTDHVTGLLINLDLLAI